MKLQKFPTLAAAILGVLSISTSDLWARGGGGHFSGGARVSVGGARFVGGGARFAVGGARFAPGRFVGRPAFVGQRFNNFNHGRFFNRRGFNNVVVAGGFGYPAYNYPYYGGYPYGYYGSQYPYANNAYPTSYPDYGPAPEPVAEQCPAPVAGDLVTNVQRALKYRGFYQGPIDGSSGATTRAAIRAYDASVGLPPTGVIDARLLQSLQLM